MKIAYITSYPAKKQKHVSTTGVASYSKNLISNIPTTGQDSIYILCQKNNKQYEKYTEDGCIIIRCFQKNNNFISPLLKEINQIKPDIIHFQQERALFGGILTSFLQPLLIYLLSKYTIVITLHGVVSLNKITPNFLKENRLQFPPFLVKAAFYAIYKPLCVVANQIIVHESYFKKILAEEYQITEQKIAVIYHGVEDFKTISKISACNQLNLRTDRTYFLYMGYLTGYKGIDLLIESFAKFTTKHPNTCLLIGAGEHPDQKENPSYAKEYLRLLIKAKQLLPDSQYKWIGFIKESDIQAYFSLSDASIYPYTIALASSGPMSMSIGFKTPFLASDVFKSIFPQDLIFKPTVTGLSDKLTHFLKNKNDYKNKLDQVKNERLWSKVSRQTYVLYEQNL